MNQEGQSASRRTVGGLRLLLLPHQSQRLRDIADRREAEEADRPTLLNAAPARVRRRPQQRGARNQRQRRVQRQAVEGQRQAAAREHQAAARANNENARLRRELQQVRRELAQLRRDFERFRARIDGDQVGNSGSTAEE